MKRFLYIFLFMLCYKSAFSQHVFLLEKPADEKADLSFKRPEPSLVFFGEDDGSPGFKKHNQNATKIKAYFGSAFSDFTIFNINTGKLVEYHNTSGWFFFYKPHIKKAYGMILSNGKEEPLIISDPDLYLKIVTDYLNIGNTDTKVGKASDTENNVTVREEMEQIMKSTFVPDQNYAKRLITNVNIIQYKKDYKREEEFQCSCRERHITIFRDSLLKEKLPESTQNLYDNQHQLLETKNFKNGEVTSSHKYIRNKNGLIEKIQNDLGNSISLTQFFYEKDRFHTVNIENAEAISFETFYLNDQMQCIRRLSKKSDGTVVWDIYYIYDQFGRLIRESQTDCESFYQYDNNQDDAYSSFKFYTLEPKMLKFSAKMSWDGNKQTIVGLNGFSEQTYRSVSVREKNCNIRTYQYDGDNKLTSVSITSCKK